ncbi:MAG: 4Fe-4S ferredoxin, iron-sulfur binding domain protein, partial [Bryobacterales bacterium]|nr:4Fe-4S ferredoxin, iron-sulfur binding domain protein [Bryobacterales bacterium]
MPSSFHSDPLHGASDDEFPDRTPDWNDEASRRRFLRLMGASIALAGSACTKQPKETIVPYVRQPEQFLPGQPLFYASAMTVAGIATGVLVESHLGRPTKIEGNPDHPASLGATNAMMQASILTLYDPDRSQTVKRNGEISTWGSFLTALVPVREAAANKKGAGLCVLTGSFSSPSLAAQIQDFKTAFPEAKWHQWEPCGRHAERAGAIAAFGQPWNTVYRFDRADRIVSLDADFLDSTTPGHLKYTRDYTARRRGAAENASAEPPRMYVVESTPSITGGMAEHRFSLRAADVEGFAASLARELGLNVPGGASTDAVRAIAKDLMSHRGSSIVIPGQFQPPRVHAIAHLINQSLGNVGQTLYYTDSVEADPVDDVASLTELVTNMRAGMVDTLFILGGNPVYDAPADVAFLDALQKVKFRTHLGLFEDETAAWCHWHVPQAHYLESWGDTRAWDGTTSIVQPLISPIYDGKTASEVLSVVLADAFPNQADRSAHDTVRAFWENQHKGKDFTGFWQTSLHDGVIAGTQFPAKTPPAARVPEPSAPAPSRSDVEITFRPDPTVGDGSLSNNAWLQELPKPQNKMTWDNAIWISPITAEQMRIALGDLVELTVMGRTIRG